MEINKIGEEALSLVRKAEDERFIGNVPSAEAIIRKAYGMIEQSGLQPESLTCLYYSFIMILCDGDDLEGYERLVDDYENLMKSIPPEDDNPEPWFEYYSALGFLYKKLGSNQKSMEYLCSAMEIGIVKWGLCKDPRYRVLSWEVMEALAEAHIANDNFVAMRAVYKFMWLKLSVIADSDPVMDYGWAIESRLEAVLAEGMEENERAAELYSLAEDYVQKAVEAQKAGVVRTLCEYYRIELQKLYFYCFVLETDEAKYQPLIDNMKKIIEQIAAIDEHAGEIYYADYLSVLIDLEVGDTEKLLEEAIEITRRLILERPLIYKFKKDLEWLMEFKEE